MVKIITDTTACLSPDYAKAQNITIIPQIINFGNESYFEGRDIDYDTFMTKLRTSKELPKTAAPPPELFTEEFKKFIPLGESILCIHPSSEVSGTVRSATVAASDFPEAVIRVVDTRTIAGPLAIMVQLAAQWVQSNKSIDEIVSQLNSLIKRSRIYFLVDTLDYLARGGRIGGASALLGSMLQIKPILTFRNGRVESYEKARTYKRALERLIEIVCEQYPKNENGYMTIMHAGIPQEANYLSEEFNRRLNTDKIPILNMPPAIVVHGGPGILGVGFFVFDSD